MSYAFDRFISYDAVFFIKHYIRGGGGGGRDALRKLNGMLFALISAASSMTLGCHWVILNSEKKSFLRKNI